MNVLKTTFILFAVLMSCDSFKRISTFWHVSDVLWQTTANNNCTNYIDKCIEHSLNILLDKNGKLHPDFILWSSAGGPYFTNVIKQMHKVLRNTIVLPSLPPVKLPAAKRLTLYYQNAADHFETWLDDKAYATFWKTGYYSRSLEISKHLQVIVLNTAFFCNFHIASELDDPADQWTWLTEELTKARNNGMKVYLLLSATPGISDSYDNKMFTFKHNRRYINIVRKFSDIIKAQFGGYEDGDKFHVFYDKKGKICGWLMLAPPFCRSARLYLYDMETVEPIDYIQFYNKKDNWHVQYRFIDRYSVPNMSTFSFERIVTKMEEDDELFSRYIASRHNKHFYKGLSVTHQKRKRIRLKLKPELGKHSLHPCIRPKHCYRACVCKVKAIDFREYIECISKRKDILFSSGMSLQTDLVMNIILMNYILIKMIVCSL